MTLTTSFQKIATGSDTTYGGAKGHLELWGKYNSQNVETNKSNITVELRLVVDYGYIGNYQATYWSVSGAVSNSGDLGSGDYRTRTLGSANGDVEHTGDGTKSISLSGSFNPTAWGYSMSVSGSCDLPTIPRASTISSVTTANVGGNPTITVDRKSSSFTHTITYTFGSLTGTVVTKSSLLTITSWTIPSTFYAQMPNNKTKDGTLTITTYSGNTQIGSSSTKTFTVSTRESDCKPIANGSVVDINSSTIFVTGDSTILVAGKSTAHVSYTATPRNSASIKTVTVNGSSAYSGTSSSAVSGTKDISNFGANSISIVTTDSRGYFDTKTLTAGTNYTLVPYIPLTFNGSVSRDAPTGNVLYITFSGKFYDHTIGNTTNSLTISWNWRRRGDSTWETGGTLTRGTDYTVDTSNNTYSSGSGSSQSAIQLGTGFNYRYDYEIQIQYSDALINTSTSLKLTKGQPIVNWGSDHFDINAYRCNINGLLNIQGKSLTQFIVESSIWIPEITALNETAPTVVYQKRQGNYCKIGKVILFNFYIKATIYALNGTNNYAQIERLPYTPAETYGLGMQTCTIGCLYNAVADTTNCVFDLYGNTIRIQNSYGSSAAKWKVTPSSQYMEVAGSGFYFTA